MPSFSSCALGAGLHPSPSSRCMPFLRSAACRDRRSRRRSGRGRWRAPGAPCRCRHRARRAPNGTAPRVRRAASCCRYRSVCSAGDDLRIGVDLPAPFSPTRPCTWPSSSSKSTSRKAVTPPKDLEIASMRRRGAPAKQRRSGAISAVVASSRPSGGGVFSQTRSDGKSAGSAGWRSGLGTLLDERPEGQLRSGSGLPSTACRPRCPS